MFSTSGTGNLHYGFYLHEPCKMITVRNTCGKYVRGHIAPIIPGIALDYSGREGVFVPASIFGRIMAVMAYGIRMKYGGLQADMQGSPGTIRSPTPAPLEGVQNNDREARLASLKMLLKKPTGNGAGLVSVIKKETW